MDDHDKRNGILKSEFVTSTYITKTLLHKIKVINSITKEVIYTKSSLEKYLYKITIYILNRIGL